MVGAASTACRTAVFAAEVGPRRAALHRDRNARAHQVHPAAGHRVAGGGQLVDGIGGQEDHVERLAGRDPPGRIHAADRLDLDGHAARVRSRHGRARPAPGAWPSTRFPRITAVMAGLWSAPARSRQPALPLAGIAIQHNRPKAIPMDLRQLEYFVRVAELGSFTRAAVELDVAQPALSRQVRLLEVELRQNLLVRNGRGAVPTEAGKVLMEHGRGILHQVQRARDDLGRLRGGLAGQRVARPAQQRGARADGAADARVPRSDAGGAAVDQRGACRPACSKGWPAAGWTSPCCTTPSPRARSTSRRCWTRTCCWCGPARRGLHEDPPPGPVELREVAQAAAGDPQPAERDPHARRIGDGLHRLQARASRWRSMASPPSWTWCSMAPAAPSCRATPC